MQIIRTATYQFSDHLRQVEALLAPIRNDRSIGDAERRQLIGEVLAAANARALNLHASRRRSADDTLAPPGAEAFRAHRFHGELARVG
jgi:hypothetical protein